MKVPSRLLLALVVAAFVLVPPASYCADNEIQLPKPDFRGKVCIEAAMAAKKSVRTFRSDPLTAAEVSQMLWAANGNIAVDATSSATTKTIPSAGGFYPLELYLVVGKDTVRGIPAGVYKYKSRANSLLTVLAGDNRNLLAYAALSQMFMARAPAIAVIAAEYSRTTGKYGQRGIQYTHMEAGSADQNMFLQAESIGLHIATVGAFNDAQVSGVLKLPASVTPLLIVPFGK